jgi:pentalenic acid synthase
MDIRRPQNQHLSFGYGVRHCLGANLARTELSIVFRSLFRAVPDLRLAVPAEELEIGRTHMLEGLVSLPVTW